MADGRSASERIARGAVVVFAGHVIALGLAFLTRVGAARMLSVDGYGLLVLGVTLLNTCALVAQLGMRAGLARNLAIADDEQAVFVSGFRIAVLLGVVVAAVLVGFSGPISRAFLGPAFAPILVAFALAVPALVAINVTVGALQGLEDAPAKAFVRNVVYRGSIIALVLGALLAGYGAVGAARGWAIGVGITAVVGVAVLHRRTALLPSVGRWAGADPSTARMLLAFSLPLMIALSTWEIMHHADNLFVGYFLTGDAVGIYDAAFTVSKLLLVFLWAFAFIFLPAFSRLYADRRRGEMQSTYRRTTRWTVLAALPLFLVLVTFSEFVLGFIFGPAYAAAWYLIVILASAFMVHSIAGPNREALIAIGEVRFVMWANLLALAANVALNATLVPLFGVIGAAVATTVTYTLLNLGLNYRLYAGWRINPLSPSVVGFVVAVGGVYGAAFVGFRALFQTTLVSVLPFVALFGVLYAVLAVVLPGGLRRGELERAIATLRQTA